MSDNRANILLVDDIPGNLFVLRAILDDMGHHLVEAHSGAEAIEKVTSDEFAVVLLDVCMPELDGFETAKLLRGQSRSRHTPIIFLTAYGIDRSLLEQGYCLGAVDFLVKPIVPVILKAKINGFVELYEEKRRAEREAQQLRLLIDGTPEHALFMLDPEGVVISWNSGAERIKQYRTEEIIGQHFSRFYIREAIERGRPAHELQSAHKNGRFKDEGWRVRKDGTQFWANVIIAPLHDEAGNLRGFSKITRDMTEQKRAEENARRILQEEAAREAAEASAQLLQEHRERLQVTLASIGDAVISTDAEGRVTFLNPVAEQLTGWSQKDAVGKPLLEVFNIVNENTRQRVDNPVMRALAEGMIVGLANHTILISKDGVERPIDDSAAPMRDSRGKTIGAVLVFRDITERRWAEYALRESESRKTAILETALDCIITVDHKGDVIEFNPAAEKTFGFPRDEVIGRQLSELIIPPSHREMHRKGLAHFLATGEAPVLNRRLELPALRADGSEFPVEVAITQIAMRPTPFHGVFARYHRTKTDGTGIEIPGRSERYAGDACGLSNDLAKNSRAGGAAVRGLVRRRYRGIGRRAASPGGCPRRSRENRLGRATPASLSS